MPGSCGYNPLSGSRKAPSEMQPITETRRTPRQAEQIIQGTTLGTVWLSLNPPGFNPGTFKTPTEIVDQINLFDQTLSEAKSKGQLAPQDLPPAAELPAASK